MNPKFIEARDLLSKARESLRRGDKPTAWRFGEQAALLAPDMEDVWLILAAADPDPKEALAYAQKALELNPSSTRAHKGVEWARGQMQQAKAAKEAAVGFVGIAPAVHAIPQTKTKSNSNSLLFATAVLGVLLCAVGIFAVYSAVTHPAFASIVKSAPTQENLWAPMEIAKPAVSPIHGSAFAPQAASTKTANPTQAIATSAPTETPEPAPTDVPTEAATFTPGPTETPGVMVMEIVADTPTNTAPQPSGALPDFATGGNGVRWIDVDLTHQAVYAYEGDVLVNSFIVSTGTSRTPTVTGKFKVYIRLQKGSMRGPGYFLPDVPYIMYFYKSYGLHGTYWHNNFGTPMSHGCVNLRTEDAAWLYNWSALGTVVNVHY